MEIRKKTTPVKGIKRMKLTVSVIALTTVGFVNSTFGNSVIDIPPSGLVFSNEIGMQSLNKSPLIIENHLMADPTFVTLNFMVSNHAIHQRQMIQLGQTYSEAMHFLMENQSSLADNSDRLKQLEKNQEKIQSELNQAVESISSVNDNILALQKQVSKQGKSSPLNDFIKNILANDGSYIPHQTKSFKSINDEIKAAHQHISKFLALSTDAIQTAQALGFEAKPEMTRVIGLMSNAVGAVGSFYSANYVGMVKNIVGFVHGITGGKTKNSPEAERFQVQLNYYDTMLKNQKTILDEVNNVKLLLTKTMFKIDLIDKKLDKLALQAENIAYLANRSAQEVASIKAGVNQIVLQQLNACHQIVPLLDLNQEDIIAANQDIRIRQCTSGIGHILGDIRMGSYPFLLRNTNQTQQTDNAAHHYLTERWVAERNLLWQLSDTLEMDKKPIAASLFHPVSNTQSVHHKYVKSLHLSNASRVEDVLQGSYLLPLHQRDLTIEDLFDERYSPEATMWLTSFSQFVGFERHLEPSKSDIQDSVEQDINKRLLNTALLRLDLAIAQESIPSDIVLSMLSDAFQRPDLDEATGSQALQVLSKNQTMAQNYVLYLLNQQISKVQNGLLKYSVATTEGNFSNTMLNALFPKVPLEFTYLSDEKLSDKLGLAQGWYAKVINPAAQDGQKQTTKVPPSLWIKLPTVEVLASGQLQFSNNLLELINLRGNVAMKLAGLEASVQPLNLSQVNHATGSSL